MSIAEEAGAAVHEDHRYRRLVDAITDYAICMLDERGYVSSWNAGAERLKGYSRAEVLGRHFSEFYSEEDRSRGLPERGLATARREGRFETEGWRIRKDGSRFWAHVVIDPIFDESGALVGFAKVTRDVTERQAAEAALSEAREALFQAQKMEAIGQLSGGIAHDFNNLLMAILSSLELVQKRLPDDPQVRRLIGNAAMAAERGAGLTQRMLAFARRQELKREAVDVAALVCGIGELMERSLGQSMSLALRFPPDLPLAWTDGGQLEAALINLALNARDAMPEGGIVTIAARAAGVEEGEVAGLRPGPYVCLSVTDTGTGMDEATVARAAEPFFTTKGVGRGTGLGLSMVHGLANQSGGALRIDSAPGRGTTVELWLPVSAEGLAPQTIQEASTLGLGPMTILAVDDDELVLLNTVAMLEELGHVALSAGCGADALAILKAQGDIDLVITDQSMPEMTGAQLAERIAEIRPGLPVMLATGYAELPGDAVSPNRLAKPFSQVDLARALEKLKRGGRSDSLAAPRN